MLFKRIFFCFSFLHLINSQLQINLHLTDPINEDENLQHNCLYVPVHIEKESDPHQLISYCMSQLSTKFKIKQNNIDQKLTFNELLKQNITSQQLYLWSAPIDLIEQYQFYLNQISKSHKTILSKKIFYNCSLPYFGPQCQYFIQNSKSYHLSLEEIIYDYYFNNTYEPTLFTCYIHLECNRGPSPSCLDWTEICDGKIDCIDNGYDEKYCWQLEIHQCNQNEYQCSNGQCIPKAFFRDDLNINDCLDQSDEMLKLQDFTNDRFILMEPSFRYEDVTCTKLLNDNKTNYFISSCVKERQELLLQAIFSIKPNSLSNECWSAMKCIMWMPTLDEIVIQKLFSKDLCHEIIQITCPNITIVPAIPLLFGHVYLAYEKNKTNKIFATCASPKYICYNSQLLYLPINNPSPLLFNNTACDLLPRLNFDRIKRPILWENFVKQAYMLFLPFQSSVYSNDIKRCNRSNMYQCINSSKCISKSRLYDGVVDCFSKDDEAIMLDNKDYLIEQNPNYFKCRSTNEFIPFNLVQDGHCHCSSFDINYCDDENLDISYGRNTISFQTICDGLTHLSSTFLQDQNETDETNCEQWPRINIYTRCDGFWHNLNGSDEINCDSSPLLNCSINHHICVSPITNKLICLPIEKANDGIIDCLGAADEPTLCRSSVNWLHIDVPITFSCNVRKQSACAVTMDICDNYQYCDNNEDEQACKIRDLSEVSRLKGICTTNYELDGNDIEKILCRHFNSFNRRWIIYFTLDQSQYLMKRNSKQVNIWPKKLINPNVQSYQQRCNRGLDIQIWLDKKQNLTRNICFCPPSYYGDICQYQNQRVSLTLQFRVTSDSVQIPFIIIISLIDDSNERIIHSYEQLTYLAMKNCQRKYNIYLLYSTRPKNPMKNYSIQIDIYEKIILKYRGSYIKSLDFSFLPVHRVALQIEIPRIIKYCSNRKCLNGKCIEYFNDTNNRTFCQCEKGWFGQFCTVKYNSTCSSDSLSLGQLANNRTLCICPLNKMGPRCLINDIICQNNKTVTCYNNGQCIPIDEYAISTKKYACVCSKEFTGDQCEINRTKLIISFNKNISLPSTILIHFIEAKLNEQPVRTTTFKTVPIQQKSIIIYWSLPFHIAFIELSNKTYYLIFMKKLFKESSIIEKTIHLSDKCLHINELFNSTILNSSFLHRIKYYHLPCQLTTNLTCFYDEIHFCFCQQLNSQRVTNCLEFDHHLKLFCSGENICENGGQCYQEHTNCSRISICQCPTCFYGSHCQLTTNGFSLSLDAILGYHIRPNIYISHQSFPVLFSLIFSIIIILAGLSNGILLLITFKNKKLRQSGCGIYLLNSSIIIILTMLIFLLKFLILLFSQIGSIKNEFFLEIQCYVMDFFLQSCLTINQLLTSFVAIERTIIIIKGIRFNMKTSKLIAKKITVSLIFLTILTNIHDPIYRKLFIENNDDEEKRIWCIIKYPSAIRIYNLIINFFHIIIPFIINIISALTIIIMSTRQQKRIQYTRNYNEILKEQIHEHKNLLIGPCVLIILAIPRLIILFASGCMKSTSDSWLFLFGYFISLIPSLLTFILFVLPSTVYKQTFRKVLRNYRNWISRHS